MNNITAVDLDALDKLKSVFEKYVPKADLDSYRLKCASDDTRVILGVSGGADSTFLALFASLYLAPNYPKLELLFTDTKNEPVSCYETLDKIERLTGFKIHRIVPEKGLFELIEQYNGFLPNGQARWCTRQLKVEPLIEYMKLANNGKGYISLAGIRYDEADREGVSFAYSMEDTSAQFPMIDLKITKSTVFAVLNETIGIPKTYAYKSRSGCTSCFFQRNQELIGLLYNDPDGFRETEVLEKLSESDMQRWERMPDAPIDVGIATTYPVPAFIDIRKAATMPEKEPTKTKEVRDTGMGDLFAGSEYEPVQKSDDLFTAVALYVDKSLGLYGGAEWTPGVYWQEFVTFSTSLAGLKSALGTYYKFKKTTPMPHYDVDDLHIVISQLRFPIGTIDTSPPSKDSFTWKSAIAYKQIRNLTSHCESVLGSVAIRRELDDAYTALGLAKNVDQYLLAEEKAIALQDVWAAAPKAPGELIWEGLYVPGKDVLNEVQLQLAGISVDTDIKKARETIEYDEVPKACVICSF